MDHCTVDFLFDWFLNELCFYFVIWLIQFLSISEQVKPTSKRARFFAQAKNKWVVRGYQHEIRNENKFPNVSGFIYDEGGKRGRLCLAGEKATWENGAKKVVGQTITDKEFASLFRLDQWNDVVIVAQGNRIKHYLNDRLILDFTDNDPELALKEGILALQLHAGKPMWAEFKNIKLRDLSK